MSTWVCIECKVIQPRASGNNQLMHLPICVACGIEMILYSEYEKIQLYIEINKLKARIYELEVTNATKKA